MLGLIRVGNYPRNGIKAFGFHGQWSPGGSSHVHDRSENFCNLTQLQMSSMGIILELLLLVFRSSDSHWVQRMWPAKLMNVLICHCFHCHISNDALWTKGTGQMDTGTWTNW